MHRIRCNFGTISCAAWLWIATNCLFAPACSLFIKGVGKVPVPQCQDCTLTDFNHPFMQTTLMFISELLCGLVYAVQYTILQYKQRKYQQFQQQKQTNKLRFKHVFLFAIPSFCDFVNFIFVCIGIYVSLASVFQMLRNLNILFVALWSLCIFRPFRESFDIPQIVGLAILFVGLFITGAISVIKPQQSAISPAYGVLLGALAALFLSMHRMGQELFVRKLNVEPSLGLAFEGMWGLIYMCISVPLANIIPNPFIQPQQMLEASKAWLYQLQNSNIQVILNVFYVAVSVIANLSGFQVTKTSSAATRATFASTNALVIWAVSMCAKWEEFDKIETPVKLIGFGVAIVGILVYNNVLLMFPFKKEVNKSKYYGEKLAIQMKQ